MEGKEKRNLLKTTILLEDNTDITFVVTHLGLTLEEKQNQFNNILDYIHIFKEDLILVGDFNTTDNDNNIVKIQQVLLDTGAKTMNRYLHTLNIFRNKDRIDYIFINRNMKIKSYKVIKNQYTDHFPVIADIEY